MMISIVEAIADLLLVRDTVVVPGLGAFVKTPVSAKVNPVANYFTMPTCEISFDANLREDNDLVINYMSERNGISEDESRRMLAMFVSDCFTNLKDGKKVELAKVGKLFYDWQGDLVFEQDKATNFNADAFGLCDISPEPVLRSKTKDEIKAEIEQQQKDKNTPVTVDEEAVHQADDDDEQPIKKKRSLVIELTLLAAVIVFGLLYIKTLHVEGPKPEELPVTTKEITQNQEDSRVTDSLLAIARVQDSIARIGSVGPILIIAGCYDRDEYAIRLVNSLNEKGFPNAFMEKRGERWYVSYGRYRSEEEAIAVLQEIRESGKGKGWILK